MAFSTLMHVVIILFMLQHTASILGAPSSSADRPESSENHREISYPSIVDDRGQHISYDIHKPEATLPATDTRTYFKLEAFGKKYLLNVSSSSHFVQNTQNNVPVVEYIGADGTSKTKTMNHSKNCFHSGHVHLMGDHHPDASAIADLERGAPVDGWVAMSSCLGLHGILATSDGYLLIEPSDFHDQQLPRTEGHDQEQRPRSHIVSRHSPSSLHSQQRTCSTTQSADTLQSSVSDSLRRRKRSTGADEFFVETTIVADRSMLSIHHREDLEAYLYTLMNIVTHLYRQPTIGHPISIVLVRTIILEDDPATLSPSNAFVLLNGFCQWQNSINGRNGPHHDVAVLVTRKDICEGSGSNCGTLGMADIASICNPARSCNVNKDIGLSTAFTIAHEIGHNLGLRHDGDPQTLNCNADMKYIMAPSFAESANPHMWSECSQRQLTDFLRSPDSVCLENRPSIGGVVSPGGNGDNGTAGGGLLLPGMEYTPTEQCQLQHGNQSTHCTGMQNECQYLWCRSSNTSVCTHGSSPPAPGTECRLSWGEMGVCFQGLCMELSLVSVPRDGGWGSWGPWSNCSLDCGTGVQFSERECDLPVPANGGRYCRGQRRQYRTCNTHSCPEGSMDFRKQFCVDNPPNDRYSSWEAVSLEHLQHLEEDMCISHCVPTGTSLLHKTDVKLPDGAPCLAQRSRGVCISRRCQPIGCDHQLNAMSKRDECGVWCGNGTSCVSVSGTYSGVDHPGYYRYYSAVTIPKGSTKITIEEVTPSHHNFIAILGASSGDTLNGNYNVLPNGLSVEFLAGATWTYERPLHATEFLRTDGHITENVTVYLLANSTYDGIRYTFSVPRELVNEISESVYYWSVRTWSECSVECGTGEQNREVYCMKLHPSGQTETVDIASCNAATKPSTRRPCNPGACSYYWEAGDWGMCDSVCGEGRQSRTVVCKWLKRNGTSEDVDNSLCDSNSKPSQYQPCQVETCRYEWHAKEWGKCDSYCGEGWMKREVVCLWMNLWLTSGGELKAATVSDSHCSEGKPKDSVECDDMEPCDNFQWSISEWSECDAPCSAEGSQFRAISCQHRNGTELPSPFCSWQDTPEISKLCQRDCSTTVPPTPSSTTVNNCRNTDSDYFCDQVVKFSLCHVYGNDCCASCANDR